MENLSASTKAKQLAKVPAALVPKPAPIGTLTLKSTWTSKTAPLDLRISLMAHRVVCASGAGFELMRILTQDFAAFLVVTFDVTPLEIAKPPPLAPIRAGSMIEFPAQSISHTSKKLEMPAGQNASDTGKDLPDLMLLDPSGAGVNSQAGKSSSAGCDNGRCE